MSWPLREDENKALLAVLHLDRQLWLDTAIHFTCVEADAFADLLDAFGLPVTAQMLLEAHAVDDDEGDNHNPDGSRRVQ